MQIPSLHWAFGPQGDGLQGSDAGGGDAVTLIKNKFEYKIVNLKTGLMVSSMHYLRGGGFGKQLVNGSPVYPSGHVQTGVWFITLHCAPAPHDPGHGSLHFSLIQAKLLAHSALIRHSGRQFGGDPMYVGKQEQDGMFPTAWQMEFKPQGDGTHGLVGVGASVGGICSVKSTN